SCSATSRARERRVMGLSVRQSGPPLLIVENAAPPAQAPRGPARRPTGPRNRPKRLPHFAKKTGGGRSPRFVQHSGTKRVVEEHEQLVPYSPDTRGSTS